MIFMQEEWKDIVDFEGLYQVSNFGRVRSLDRVVKRGVSGSLLVRGQILKPQISKGYYYVRLCNSGFWKSILVHRLVAQAFIPNTHDLPEINHKDENKLNNCSHNLEWCTRQYNVNYGDRSRKFSESMKGKLSGDRNPMYGKIGAFKGHTHSEKTKQNLSAISMDRIWINNGMICKRVKENDLQLFLDNGWVRGRKT